MKAPTRRQLVVLQALYDLTESKGVPSLREVMGRVGIRSTNALADHYHALQRRGLVRYPHGTSRTVTITDRGLAELGVPQPVKVLPELCCKCCGASRFGPGSCPICGADSAHMEVA